MSYSPARDPWVVSEVVRGLARRASRKRRALQLANAVLYELRREIDQLRADRTGVATCWGDASVEARATVERALPDLAATLDDLYAEKESRRDG